MDEGALGMEREGGAAPLPADNDDGGGLLMVLVVGLISILLCILLSPFFDAFDFRWNQIDLFESVFGF